MSLYETQPRFIRLILGTLTSLGFLALGLLIFSMFVGAFVSFVAFVLMVLLFGMWVKLRYPGGFHARIVVERSGSAQTRYGPPQAYPDLDADKEAPIKQVRLSRTKGNS